ncbi:hypothetical protein BCJMU51_0927 [Bacillus cereus]|nr:hypothetical protein A3782_18240 [Bacillus sp. GZT]BCB36057.1 hypothetical protein BCM0045_0952 [Bacillus cereus]BCB98869.1 hypothetical protein BCM0057_0952 [Bacillus cereus]BCC22365.1 hypothetical protein BCM0079_0958 [Bacillus cereus]BCC33973.1 hypothetical protein BCM0105_0963 [Bacillus cereus]
MFRSEVEPLFIWLEIVLYVLSLRKSVLQWVHEQKHEREMKLVITALTIVYNRQNPEKGTIQIERINMLPMSRDC